MPYFNEPQIYMMSVTENNDEVIKRIIVYDNLAQVQVALDQLCDNKQIGAIKDFDPKHLSLSEINRMTLESISKYTDFDNFIKLVKLGIREDTIKTF